MKKIVRCNRCPIKKECNKHPVLVNRPNPRNPKGKPIKIRLCPLLIAVQHAFDALRQETAPEEKRGREMGDVSRLSS